MTCVVRRYQTLVYANRKGWMTSDFEVAIGALGLAFIFRALLGDIVHQLR